MDAAIDAAPVCAVQCDNSAFCGAGMGTGTFPALRIGNKMATPPAPSPGDWFITFSADAGPLANRKAFDIFVSPSPMGANPLDIFSIRLLKPQTGNFPLNMAVNFDPDPNSATPTAWSFWLGNAAISGNMITGVEQEYYASSGAITLVAMSEQDQGIIEGSTSPIQWRQIDAMTGQDVPGGCTASMGVGSMSNTGFGFYLQQMATAFDDQTPTEFAPGWRILTGDEAAAAKAYLDKRIAERQ